MMTKARFLFALLLTLCPALASAQTINPTLPAAALPYSATVIRNQFQAAINDIAATRISQTVLTGTGAQNICLGASRTIWRPLSPAPATLTLPAVAISNQPCVIDNESSSLVYAATIVPNSGQTILAQNGSGNILLGPPGSSITFVYNAAVSQWVME